MEYVTLLIMLCEHRVCISQLNGMFFDLKIRPSYQQLTSLISTIKCPCEGTGQDVKY